MKRGGETHYNLDGTVNTKDFPYRGTVIIKDKDGNLIEKFAHKGESSFFPDDWDSKRIQEEVKYAIENNIGTPPKLGKTTNIIGYSKPGTSTPQFEILIQYDPKNEKKPISSFYPYFSKKK